MMFLAIFGFLSALALGGFFLRSQYLVISVEGMSMAPSLKDGDRLLARRCRAHSVRAGEIVIVVRPDPVSGWKAPGAASQSEGTGVAWYVKRAIAVGGQPVPAEFAAQARVDPGERVPAGTLLILGDNPRSDDSKQWGPCPDHLVRGRVLRRFR
ncbi:S26 family signal peptidase [Streptacidiphilus sp. EB103A]|uniref:S26 family signal peptidase n=1 Tax=Streptacidiphilus sp. EB103A TaxID=3156275 RepID=UPI003516B376